MGFLLGLGDRGGNLSGCARTHITQLQQCECRANRLGMAAFGRKAEIKAGYKLNYMNFAMGKDSNYVFLSLL